jgi:putative membrane-bound dehydrogenase-like protein
MGRMNLLSKAPALLGLAIGFAGSAASAELDLLQEITLPRELEISLFAMEPQVVDPVALTFDEYGRMYVVEMRDFPYGKGPSRQPMGTIRLLQDTNADGKADRSTLFARDVSFPTSIAPWNGGVIVTAPPQILYLKDKDGDGIADERRVLFDGFVLGVTDSNVNGLRWGLDNRLHGLNGGNGGLIASPGNQSLSAPIDDVDFAFDPQTLAFAVTSQASAGFGLAFDDWGRSFVTYNINHIQHRHLPARFLRRQQSLPPVTATLSISDHEEMARIFPISKPVTRENHPEQSGHFSSAGGVGILSDRRWPNEFYGNVLIGDVVGNLIHRDVITPAGPSFRASRGPSEQKSEFLASRNPASRFVAFETGPDGALYVADMQRDVIEHPDYIPDKVKQKVNLRAGEDRGRIFRIAPRKGKEQFQVEKLDRKQPLALVQQLENPNPWVRTTAHRLLLEEQPGEAIPLLRAKALSPRTPQAAVHALWLLAAYQQLREEDLMAALDAQEIGVKENACWLVNQLVPPGNGKLPKAIQQKLIAFKDGPERLRFVAALVLGDYPNSQTIAACKEIWRQNQASRWIRLAALSSLGPDAGDLLAVSLPRSAKAIPDAVQELADMIAAAGGKLSAFLKRLGEADETIQLAFLEGWRSGLDRTNTKSAADPRLGDELERFAADAPPEVFGEAWALGRQLGLPETNAQREALQRASQAAGDGKLSEAARAQAVGLLRFSSFEASANLLEGILQSGAGNHLQKAIFAALKSWKDDRAGGWIVKNWPFFGPSLRTDLINFILSRRGCHPALVSAIETKQIALGELNLDLEQRRTLLRESSPDIHARAARFISDEEYSNRKEIVSTWLDKLPATGDPAKGRQLFQQTCSKCHRLAGEGFAVGPDLSSVAHRSVEDLLSNILDPNMAINPNYINYTAFLEDGDSESGILEGQTSEAVVLLQPEGKKLALPRSRIKQLRASGVSLMPEGLEAGMKPEDLRNLIAFLQE